MGLTPPEAAIAETAPKILFWQERFLSERNQGQHRQALAERVHLCAMCTREIECHDGLCWLLAIQANPRKTPRRP